MGCWLAGALQRHNISGLRQLGTVPPWLLSQLPTLLRRSCQYSLAAKLNFRFCRYCSVAALRATFPLPVCVHVTVNVWPADAALYVNV